MTLVLTTNIRNGNQPQAKPFNRWCETHQFSLLQGDNFHVTFPTRVCLVKAMVFPVVMYGCESWAIKKAECQRIDAFELWCWRRLQSPLDCKEIQPVNPKGNQSRIFIGRTDAEAEVPILWTPRGKNWLIRKDPDAGKDWRQEEKGTTEDEMVGWHQRLGGHEFEQAPGVGDEQECCRPWGRKELHTTELLKWTELKETTETFSSDGGARRWKWTGDLCYCVEVNNPGESQSLHELLWVRNQHWESWTSEIWKLFLEDSLLYPDQYWDISSRWLLLKQFKKQKKTEARDIWWVGWWRLQRLWLRKWHTIWWYCCLWELAVLIPWAMSYRGCKYQKMEL